MADRRYAPLKSGLPGGTGLSIGDLGDGDVLYWDATSGKWTTGIMQLGWGGTNNPFLRFITDAGDQVGSLQSIDSTDQFVLTNNIHGGQLRLNGEDTGGVGRVMASFDPDESFTLFQTGSAILAGGLHGTSGGSTVTITDTSGTDRAWLVFKTDTSGASGGANIAHYSDGNIYFDNRRNSGSIILRGWDSGGVARTLIEADPNNNVALSYAGTVKMTTTTQGISLSGTADDSVLAFTDVDGEIAHIYKDNAGPFRIINREHGQPTELWSENNAGTSTILFSGDPDSLSQMYYAGFSTVRTAAAGVNVVANSGGNTEIGLYNSSSTQIGRIVYSSANLFIDNMNDGANMYLRCDNAAGGTVTILSLDPDADGMWMNNALGDRFAIYAGLDAATNYAFGIESGTMYYKANGNHRFYCSVNADGGTSDEVSITSSGTQMATPTGGLKGTGTLNAKAVYDDNVLLTCMPIEEALGRSNGRKEWDDMIVGRERHPMVDQYEADKADGWDGTKEGWRQLMETRGSVPGLPNKAQLQAMHEQFEEELPYDPAMEDTPPTQMSDRRMSLGEVGSRVWLALDYMAVALRDSLNHNDQLLQRIEALEERLNEHTATDGQPRTPPTA